MMRLRCYPTWDGAALQLHSCVSFANALQRSCVQVWACHGTGLEPCVQLLRLEYAEGVPRVREQGLEGVRAGFVPMYRAIAGQLSIRLAEQQHGAGLGSYAYMSKVWKEGMHAQLDLCLCLHFDLFVRKVSPEVLLLGTFKEVLLSLPSDSALMIGSSLYILQAFGNNPLICLHTMVANTVLR